jgi:hypothetical protein
MNQDAERYASDLTDAEWALIDHRDRQTRR